MNLPAHNKHDKFNYRDYCGWPAEERWELIDGNAYNMTPASSRIHQDLLVKILTQFSNYLKDKNCEVYPAPFDVRLAESGEIDDMIETVVQPDISVICDKNKLDDKGCRGAPDLIVEILSPATAGKDLNLKRKLYERFKVREYWVVSPSDHTVTVFLPDENGHYMSPVFYTSSDTLKISVFNDFSINLSEIFPAE